MSGVQQTFLLSLHYVEDRRRLGNERKMQFFFALRSAFTIFAF